MKFDWIVMILIFGIVQGFFTIYMMTFKKNGKGHLPFILWLAVLLIILIESFSLQSGIIKYVTFIFKTTIPLIFLVGPLLYEYTITGLGKAFNNRQRLLHYIPFFFYLAYSFNFFLQPHSYKHNIIAKDFHPEWELLYEEHLFSADPWNINGWIIVEIIFIHLVIYCVLGVARIVQFRTLLSKEKKNWLLYLNIILFLSAILLFFSQGGVVNGKVFLETFFPRYSPSLFVAFIVYLISLYTIVKSDLLNTKSKKYLKSTITDSYKKKKLKMIKDLIEGEHLYLSDSFSLGVLAEKSGLSTHHISQILNEELQCTFFELTNNYRINEAKKRLHNSEEYIKIEHLAYDLGYKSKSTFYAAFKKATQLTPIQYRNSIS